MAFFQTVCTCTFATKILNSIPLLNQLELFNFSQIRLSILNFYQNLKEYGYTIAWFIILKVFGNSNDLKSKSDKNLSK